MRFSPLWILLATAALLGCASQSNFREGLERGTGVVHLPAGVVEVSSELLIPDSAHDLEIIGHPDGTVLRVASAFEGRAVLRIPSGQRIKLSGFELDGNRDAFTEPKGLPPYVAFAGFYSHNGILAENVEGLTIENVTFRNVADFPILVSASSDVQISSVTVEDSGSLNQTGRNNATGGILLEEGVADFRVEDSTFHNIRGNAVWTHSLYESPRNRHGRITGNRIEGTARDAIQVGHAVDIIVSGNTGRRIGYPVEEVDLEGYGFPVAIDTAGNVEQSVYSGNRFEEINGKCIDLDGFHDGEVRDNVCINRGRPEDYRYGNFGIAMNNSNPDMRSEGIVIEGNEIDGALYSGILVIGTGNVIRNNRLINLNLADCNENEPLCTWARDTDPSFLRSGVYLARGAEREDPASGNLIEDNTLSGHSIADYCVVAAPGVSLESNTVAGNHCESVD